LRQGSRICFARVHSVVDKRVDPTMKSDDMDERAELLARIKTPDPNLDELKNRVLIAMAEFNKGFPVDQLCPCL